LVSSNGPFDEPSPEPGLPGPARRRTAARRATDTLGAWRSDGAARWLFIWPAVLLILALSLFPLVASVAGENDLDVFSSELGEQERDLVKRLVELPTVIAEATERRGPHLLTNYAIYVADDFHRFYHHHRVLESGDAQAFRLGLCRATQTVVARALDLIGVEAPERM